MPPVEAHLSYGRRVADQLFFMGYGSMFVISTSPAIPVGNTAKLQVLYKFFAVSLGEAATFFANTATFLQVHLFDIQTHPPWPSAE